MYISSDVAQHREMYLGTSYISYMGPVAQSGKFLKILKGGNFLKNLTDGEFLFYKFHIIDLISTLMLSHL